MKKYCIRKEILHYLNENDFNSLFKDLKDIDEKVFKIYEILKQKGSVDFVSNPGNSDEIVFSNYILTELENFENFEDK